MRRPLAAAFLVAGLVASASPARSQLPGLETPRPTPAPWTPAPTRSPDPTARPTAAATPEPSAGTPEPTSQPGLGSLLVPGNKPTPSPSGGPKSQPRDGTQSVLPGIPSGYRIPILARTAGRNTSKLVSILGRVTQYGIPLEQALAEGTGRLPVGGLAYWSDDWQAPRFTPIFHLHEGLDVFAEFGTPVRSPDAGVVSRLTNSEVGGVAAYVSGRDGTEYYFAHMQGYAPGLTAGQSVEAGAVLGYVGDSGNAKGGAPHLHFEIHKPGPVPPKPYVDKWLDEAETQAAAWVDARIAELVGERDLLRSDHSLAELLRNDRMRPGDTPEYSLLLSVLDPVAGSVGLLPRVALVPVPRADESQRLMKSLVRQRVDGSVLTALITGGVERTDAGG